VQHAIAAKTRTVAYDNAGFGFSDPGPLPRTASAIVNDLRAALKAAAIAPPYVLAGWSFGGLIMRLFAFNHPQDVVGMAMVDSSSERQIGLFANDPKAMAWRRKLLRVEQLARAGDLVAGAPEYDEFVVHDGAPKLPAAVKAARRAQRTLAGLLPRGPVRIRQPRGGHPGRDECGEEDVGRHAADRAHRCQVLPDARAVGSSRRDVAGCLADWA
jgi:pimeloyl-ACP methyl ester carboxylesterase